MLCIGNRWLVSIWTATPHAQPPLDVTELEEIKYVSKNNYYTINYENKISASYNKYYD